VEIDHKRTYIFFMKPFLYVTFHNTVDLGETVRC